MLKLTSVEAAAATGREETQFCYHLRLKSQLYGNKRERAGKEVTPGAGAPGLSFAKQRRRYSNTVCDFMD